MCVSPRLKSHQVTNEKGTTLQGSIKHSNRKKTRSKENAVNNQRKREKKDRKKKAYSPQQPQLQLELHTAEPQRGPWLCEEPEGRREGW
jgi:hypothetical protein